MKVDGACACGAIKVEAEADPEKTQVCHCTDCQTATGTAFRVSIPVAGATFKIIGKPAIYVKTTAESGRPRVQAFCGTCGSPIYSTTPGECAQLLHAAGRHFAPARPAYAAAPVLVAIGTVVGHRHHRRPQIRKTKLIQERTMIVTVFRSRLKPGLRDEYVALANRMNELARTMPGYISHKDFYADDGERVAVVEFAHAEGQRAWQNQSRTSGGAEIGAGEILHRISHSGLHA